MRPLPVISVPDSWADWPDDRVSCADCRNRSAHMCVAMRISHVPVEVKHRCEKFSKRVEFRRAA